MVTSARARPTRRPFYLKEWRKFMGTKPEACGEAIGIQRQSYHRLEKNWWTISAGEIDTLCRLIGIKPEQLWFPPPKPGQPAKESLDEIIQNLPEPMQRAAIMAVRGIAGK